jgi:hypothetical protein
VCHDGENRSHGDDGLDPPGVKDGLRSGARLDPGRHLFVNHLLNPWSEWLSGTEDRLPWTPHKWFYSTTAGGEAAGALEQAWYAVVAQAGVRAMVLERLAVAVGIGVVFLTVAVVFYLILRDGGDDGEGD